MKIPSPSALTCFFSATACALLISLLSGCGTTESVYADGTLSNPGVGYSGFSLMMPQGAQKVDASTITEIPAEKIGERFTRRLPSQGEMIEDTWFHDVETGYYYRFVLLKDWAVWPSFEDKPRSWFNDYGEILRVHLLAQDGFYGNFELANYPGTMSWSSEGNWIFGGDPVFCFTAVVTGGLSEVYYLMGYSKLEKPTDKEALRNSVIETIRTLEAGVDSPEIKVIQE